MTSAGFLRSPLGSHADLLHGDGWPLADQKVGWHGGRGGQACVPARPLSASVFHIIM